MADQEFLASFAVEIDESGVSRLQQVLEENRDLAEEVASAFEAATEAIREYEKAALGGDNPSGEGNRDDGAGKGAAASAEGTRDTGSSFNPEASARNLENGEYRSEGYKGEIQALISGSLTENPDATVRDYSLRTAELSLARALAPDEGYDINIGRRVDPDTLSGDSYYDSHSEMDSKISRYLYDTLGPRADTDLARDVSSILTELHSAESRNEDTSEYLEQLQGFLPDLLQGVRDIVDRYDKPETEGTEGAGGDGSPAAALDLEEAREELGAFREEAAEPVRMTGSASGIVSAASSAFSSVKEIFSRPLTIRANVETEPEEDGGDGPKMRMSAGGRFSKPTDVQVAEDGDAEYIIPVKKENRAVPLLRQLMGELSPEARESLAVDEEDADAVPEDLLQDAVPVQAPGPVKAEEAKPAQPQAKPSAEPLRQAASLPLPAVREVIAEPQPAPVPAGETAEEPEKDDAPPEKEPEKAPQQTVIRNYYETMVSASLPLPAVREVIDTPAARQPLAAASDGNGKFSDSAAGLLSGLGDVLSASLHEASAPVVQNTSQNVSAPVNIQVHSTGANAEQVGQSLYDTAERYLLRTLKGAMA